MKAIRLQHVYWHWYDVVLALALAGLLYTFWVTESWKPHRAVRPLSPPPAQTVSAYGTDIFIWDERTRTLTVSSEAPADLLICIRDEDHCDLPEGWRARVGVTGH